MRLLVSGRRVVARIPRLVKTGVIVALLAFLTLGSVGVIGAGRFGVPTAHAASSCQGPVQGNTQAIAGINDLTHPDPNNPNFVTSMSGAAAAFLTAYFDQYGDYCGMTVQAHADLNPGSHGGYLWGGLYDCNGNYQTGTNVLLMSNQKLTWYTVESSELTQTCGFVAVEVWYYDNLHHKVYMQAVSSEWHECCLGGG